MYNIKFEDYIPEPKPAKSDRIVAAHYYAAWKTPDFAKFCEEKLKKV